MIIALAFAASSRHQLILSANLSRHEANRKTKFSDVLSRKHCQLPRFEDGSPRFLRSILRATPPGVSVIGGHTVREAIVRILSRKLEFIRL